MPGNEVGDRVHNFFAQDTLSHSQHHSQVSGGNWAVPNNNLWVGSQRQIDVLSSNLKDYNPQQSDLERGHTSHSLQVQHGLNSKHSSLRPELTRSQSHNQHPNLNGAIYGRQVFQTRPGEANFLGVDTESDQNDLIERGLSIYQPSQGSHPNRLESSESPVSFDLFGGQQQMFDQHPGVLQSLPQQQSGFADMQQLQQQFMLRKMQELQKQKDLRQLDARQQNSVNQVPFLTRQTSGNHSHALINGTPISDASWATELTAGNTKWLQHASPAMQGSSSGHVFSPDQGQSSRSVGLVYQQVDQSLHGVPVSNSRGSSNQYPHIAADKSPQHIATYSNSFQGNHYAVFPEQVSMQDGTLIDRPGFQGKNLFGHTSNQGVNSGINMENLQRLNPLERNVPLQEFQGRQERDSPSEILQEKTAVQAVSSQNSVALDPTEEKILFGSDDDSIWDAFGRNTDMSGGASNLLDGTGFMSGFPSIQSGSWSALMQSAVAETSSSDVGLQEGWTGLSFQNPGLPAGNHQPSMYNGTGKHQTALADTNLQISSAFSFGSVPPSDDANLKNNYHTVQGFQQFGQKISQENGERLQNNSSQRPIQQSPAGGSEWLNCGSQICGNASHSVDGNMNGQNILSNWTPQQSGSSQLSNKSNNWRATESVTTGGDASFDIHENEKSIQTSQKNDQNRVLHEKLSKKDGVLKVNSMPNSVVELEQLRSTMVSPQLNREESSLNTAVAATNLSNARASRETSQFLPNSHHLNNWKHVDTSVKSKGSNRSGKSQHPLNKGPQLVESSLNSSEKEEIKRQETDSFNKTENHNDSYRSNVSHHTSAAGLRENVLSDASDSRSLAGGKQKSSNQVGWKTSGLRKFQYHPMGNLDEDVEPPYRTRQATHSQSMHLHKSDGFKSQHQESFGQSKLFGQIPNNSTETGKGQLPDRQRDTKGLDEVASRDIPPGYGSNTSSPLDRSVGMIAANKASHTSQNMIELLHKVDQLEERGVVMHFSSSERNPLSETPKSENSDGTGGLLQQNQSAGQGCGLQLAPPSQRLPVSNHVSQSPMQTVNSCTSTLATSGRGDKVQIELSPSTSGQSLPSSHERSQGEFKNNRTVIPGQTPRESSVRTIQGNFSSAFNSGFPYSRSQPQDQLMSGARRQGSMNQSIDVPLDRHALPSKQVDDCCSKLTGQSAVTYLHDAAGSVPYDNAASFANISHLTALNNLHERAPDAHISAGEVVSISQPFTTTGISQQDAFPKTIPNIWTNVPVQQHFLGAQARQVQSKLSQPRQSDIVESTSSVQRSLEDQGAKMRGNVPSELGAGSVYSQGFVCGEEQLTEENPCQQASSVNIDLVQKMNESQRKGDIIQHLPDASPSNSASTQRDIEAFGRSLKPNNFFHQNFSLLNQMQALKNVETDPSNRGLKRLKGSNTILVGEQVASKSGQANECNAMVGEALVSRSSVPSGDPTVVSFSESKDYLEINASSSQLGNVPSQDVLVFDQNGNSTASVRIEHSKISPHMAPSWFNRYGTFKNEQMLQMYDARKANIVKTVEQPFALEKSSSSLHMLNSMEHVNAAAGTSQIGHNRQGSTSASLAIENCSLPQSLLPDNVGQQFGVLRPKKRKKATSDLQSWNKEVSQGSLNLQTIRMAEAGWAKAANRLCEKVEDTADMIEDGLPICRARRRRIILTTQLMQQLFRAPPAVILSADASLNSEIVAYFVARLALGDACSLMSCSKSYSDVHPEGANFQADKCKTSDGNGDLNLSQVMEDFMDRVRKLENDLLRLDKRASVLDLRVECQDVEKFSVMNRFAKFHGRWQTDGAETSSLSDTAVNVQKPFTQKYVTVVPLPRNLPDRETLESLRKHATYQRRMFDQAVQLVRPGGVIVYSTCTINPGENEALVRYALDTYTFLSLASQHPRIGGPGLVGRCALSDGYLEEWLRPGEEDFVQRFDPSSSLDTIGFFIAKFSVGSKDP